MHPVFVAANMKEYAWLTHFIWCFSGEPRRAQAFRWRWLPSMLSKRHVGRGANSNHTRSQTFFDGSPYGWWRGITGRRKFRRRFPFMGSGAFFILRSSFMVGCKDFEAEILQMVGWMVYLAKVPMDRHSRVVICKTVRQSAAVTSKNNWRSIIGLGCC